MDKFKETAGKIFTTANLKKLGACVLVGAVAFGGFNWYQHQSMNNEFRRVAEARTHIVEQKAAKNGVELIDQAQVKAIAADAMGVDETAVTWDIISLADGPEGMFMPHPGVAAMHGHPGFMAGALCGPDNRRWQNCPREDGHRGYGGPHHGWSEDNDGHYGHYGMGPGHFGGPRGPRGNHQMQGMGPGPGFFANKDNQDNQPAQLPPAFEPQGKAFDPNELKEKGMPMPPMPQNAVADKTSPANEAKGEADKKDFKDFAFHPAYNVICEVNGVRYHVAMDAVNGHVFRCHAGMR